MMSIVDDETYAELKAQAKRIGQGLEFGVGLIIDDRHHQQDGLGTVGARRIDLNRSDDEVLAQNLNECK